MIATLKREFSYQVVIAFFVYLTVWWLVLYLSGSKSGFQNLLFGAVYGTVMSGLGAFLGFRISKYWGGLKSQMGRVIIVLALGLLAEFFGQVVFSVYNIFLQVEIPYPSIADIGYFGNIPLYIYGALLLLKVSGGKINLRSITSQIQAVVIPLLVLTGSYFLFLQTYVFDWSNPLKIFLDFGYPLGQALYISIAILTYSLSRSYLGGIMKSKILLLLIAFALQYIADVNFLFQSSRGTWYNGGYGDYLYLVAYFVMTFGLLQLGMSSIKVRSQVN